ncbi:MAG: hypothetical protein E7D20_19720, partial [Citrobacter freundii]|nr:hypothetical protein [Citrobacter freundii]
TLKMPAFEWVHVQLHQQKGMISLSPPTICNSATARQTPSEMIPNTTIFNRMHFSLLNERENSSFSSLSAYSINQRE